MQCAERNACMSKSVIMARRREACRRRRAERSPAELRLARLRRSGCGENFARVFRRPSGRVHGGGRVAIGFVLPRTSSSIGRKRAAQAEGMSPTTKCPAMLWGCCASSCINGARHFIARKRIAPGIGAVSAASWPIGPTAEMKAEICRPA